MSLDDLNYQHLKTPIGRLLVAGKNSALAEIRYPTIVAAGRRKPATPDPRWKESRYGLATILRQMREYFAGTRTDFDLELRPEGTAFQQSVWQELQRIPYGQTISYAELARRIGKPKACRAVGAANGRNPIPIVIPCHRVIGSSGHLTGYGGGTPAKEWLLRHEEALLASSAL